MVGDGNHHKMPGFDGVDEAVGKAPNQDAAKAMGNEHPELGTLPDRVDCILEVIEKIMSETRRR